MQLKAEVYLTIAKWPDVQTEGRTKMKVCVRVHFVSFGMVVICMFNSIYMLHYTEFALLGNFRNMIVVLHRLFRVLI